MTTTKNSPATCPWCKAAIKGETGYCWKCGVWLDVDEQGDITALKDRPESSPHEPGGFSYNVSTLLLVTTLIAVCLALAVAAPGLGIMLAIVSLPPFIRTLLLVERKKKMGQDISAMTKVGLYLGSFGVTLVVTIVTLVTSVGAFCLTCLGLYSASNASGMPEPQSVEFAMPIASFFSLLIAILLIWTFSKWIRRRWKRDLNL